MKFKFRKHMKHEILKDSKQKIEFTQNFVTIVMNVTRCVMRYKYE
jgi:hypothetical protein